MTVLVVIKDFKKKTTRLKSDHVQSGFRRVDVQPLDSQRVTTLNSDETQAEHQVVWMVLFTVAQQ